jgi:hypothetical protein
MKSLAATALALCLAVPGASAQQSENSSGSYGNSRSNSRNSAAARVGGQPSNVPERGSSAEGRARAGYDVGVASAKAGGRTDTGPVGDTGTRRRTSERDEANAKENAPWRRTPPGSTVDRDLDRAPVRQPPSLAQASPEEIRQEQQRGRIRDRDIPDWIRGRGLSELEVANKAQLEEVLKDPYRHRQADLPP